MKLIFYIMTDNSFLHNKFAFISLSVQIKRICVMFEVHYKLAD